MTDSNVCNSRLHTRQSSPPCPMRLVHVVNAGKVLRPFLEGQLRFMEARGFDVAVCAPAGTEVDEFCSRERIRALPYEVDRSVAPGKDVRAIAQLYRHFSRFRPHIVHAHGPKAGLVAMIAARLAKAPIRIYHVRGLPFLSDTQPQWLLRTTTRLTCALANEVLTISPSMTRELVSAGCCPPTKVKSFGAGSGNGVDASARFNPDKQPADVRQCVRAKFGLPNDAFVLGFVGRIVKDKGIIELLAAWEVLRSVHPTLHMMLVGPFEQQDPIPIGARNRITSDPRLCWVGENWDTPSLYAAMDLLALPSYREGLGMVLLEAAAMRLPVIATEIPGCIDTVQHGITGTLIPPHNAEALAGAVANYVVDPVLCRRHGHNGRARVLQYFEQRPIWEATHAEYVRLRGQCGFGTPEAPIDNSQAA